MGCHASETQGVAGIDLLLLKRVINCSTNFQLLIRQAFADDEASTRLLQILLFLLLSTASIMFIPCAVTCRSSFTLSIHFFGCLPLLLVPSTCPYSATTGSLFPSILITCPNHVSLLFLIFSTNVTCCPSSFLVTSLRILSLLDLPSILRSQLISATSIVLSSSFLRHQHSDPYIITGIANVPYSFTLVAVVILFDLHTLFIVPNIAEASPILRFMSFVERPSSIITPPK